MMREKVNQDDVDLMKKSGNVYAVLLGATVLLATPLTLLFDVWGLLAAGLLALITLLYALKVEKLKKRLNIHTYKEIMAYMEGNLLDRDEKNRELGKRPYQQVLLAFAGGVIAAFVGWMMILIFT